MDFQKIQLMSRRRCWYYDTNKLSETHYNTMSYAENQKIYSMDRDSMRSLGLDK